MGLIAKKKKLGTILSNSKSLEGLHIKSLKHIMIIEREYYILAYSIFRVFNFEPSLLPNFLGSLHILKTDNFGLLNTFNTKITHIKNFQNWGLSCFCY